MTLYDKELATVLFALRDLQAQFEGDEPSLLVVMRRSMHFDELEIEDVEECADLEFIDRLCEKLNFEDDDHGT